MVSSKQFTYSAKSRCFIAELSDFNGKELFHRVWPDSCDEGITMVSEGTGREATFVIDEEKYDKEGDLLWYKLIPTKETLRKVPEVSDTSIKIFND